MIRKHTEETKRKMSLIKIGRHLWRNRIHPKGMLGKKHTESTKLKISMMKKGKPMSYETKIKISKSNKGKYRSIEQIKKMTLALKGRTWKNSVSSHLKGKKRDEQTIRKIILGNKRKPNNFEKHCINIFKKNNLELVFTGDGKNEQFIIGGKIPDFVSTNNSKIIVEVFYDYFKIKRYGTIENYIKERNIHFQKYGWKTLFFSCNEIYRNEIKVIEIIKSELNKEILFNNI